MYKHTSSEDCTQYGLYNLKQYDHNQILNDLIHITLLHTINICAELNYACKPQYIININIYKYIYIYNIYKYIKQERIKSQLVNLFQKCSEYYNT